MDRYTSAKKVGILGIFGNLILLIIKAIVGFSSHSQAMISDAANSATDIFASLMTFIGNKIASEPGDTSHNFGHGKAEYIFSLFISISMIFLSLNLLYNSVTSLITGNKIIFSWSLVIVCIITILTKLILYIYTKKLLKNGYNILIESTMKDHRNDCVLTTVTLISIIFSLFNIYFVDGLVGIGISVWICYTGIKIFIESYNVLMDISIDENTKELILALVDTYPDIKCVENISSTPVGAQYIIFITICVDGNMSTFDSHGLADSLEKNITEINKIYKTIVHVNPI